MAQSESFQFNTFASYIIILSDGEATIDKKLRAAQELSEHFEEVVQSSSYASFLEHSLKVFVHFLQVGEPQFIQEYQEHQIRKVILEMIHRLPISENLRQHVKSIISLMLKILRTDNEENVLVCLRIIIELHKNFRPSYNIEVCQFLVLVKNIFTGLPNHINKIFKPAQQICIKDLNELNLEQLLSETYAIKSIKVENPTSSAVPIQTYNLLPRGMLSLRVLQELPIIVVLMYQIYKNAVLQEVSEFIPLVMTTINFQPSVIHRNSQFFNKEIFIDFMGAQIKTLSFLAYIVQLFQDTIMRHSVALSSGILSLMQLCPKEAAHLRKELLIAVRHIFATDLKQICIPFIDRFFDEDLLIGKGVTLDSIRPLAYSMLADLTHHVRENLSLDVLEKAIKLFSKNAHDESLATGIQTMSCKLLLNLVDCVRLHSEVQPVKARNLLTTLLKVFVYKFQNIANITLPTIKQKLKAQSSTSKTSPMPSYSSSNTTATVLESNETISDNSSDPSKLAGNQMICSVNIVEYINLVKILVGGVKTITWGFVNSKSLTKKLFDPSEISIYIDLVHSAMDALDVYSINTTTANQLKTSEITARTKDENDVLDHFSGIFLMMHSQNFQEVFVTTIDFMVERISKNPSLQILVSSFLGDSTMSPIFATVLVEYLLGKMNEMGTNVERSNLYLRLFKLAFGCVNMFPVENQQMLKPHLRNIINKSMELALTAEEPYNYFLLLRCLFRSIGGGSHDVLYQEFLPLLPNFLEGLNRLQSGFHKKHMKDIFVELCLTLPVRLSCLLPYLPLLMDPLVSALNGTANLVLQGLRTLELCIDNLQPDYLYDNIQPIRAALMQALWKAVRNQDNVALAAFRLLGKFGGCNRNMMTEPQSIQYTNSEIQPTAVVTYFQEHKNPIEFPIDKAIETAFSALSSNATESFYRRQGWEVIRCFLAASINLDDEKHTLQKFFLHPSFLDNNIENMKVNHNKIEDCQARKTLQIALTGMFVALAIKDLRQYVIPVMVAVVRHYTVISVAQQAGPFPYKQYNSINGIDPLVLIDALAICMGHEEKELCKPGQLCIRLILDTAVNILGTKERACRLPLMKYLAEKMTALCYERAWYGKMGGCKAIHFLYQHFSFRSLYQHLFSFVKAFMFVLMDLEGEVSHGAIYIAKTNLRSLLDLCMTPKEHEVEEIATIKNKAIYDVIHELVRQITSPNTLVRQESMASLKHIASIQNRSVSEVMDPHKEVLADIVPPKKNLLRHQPANAQIGLIEGNTFCITLEPRFCTINLTNNSHKLFVNDLLTISEAEDSTQMKLDCYKNVTNLVPLRISALRALAACHYITDTQYKFKITNILFKLMAHHKPELQEAAFKCMKRFNDGTQIDQKEIHNRIQPLLLTLGDHRNFKLTVTKRLFYFTRLFPQTFDEKLNEQILQLCQNLLEISIQTCKQGQQGGNFFTTIRGSENEQKVVYLIEIFHQITAATPKYIEDLCQLVLQIEKNLMIESSSPYRAPLLKFLLRFPNDTVAYFLSDDNIVDAQWNRFFIYLLKQADGQSYHNVLKTQQCISCLIRLIGAGAQIDSSIMSEAQKQEAQEQAIKIVYIVMENDDQWIVTQTELINCLKHLWQFNLSNSCQENVISYKWHLVGKILLKYFSHHTDEIELLFQLSRALCLHLIPDFHFLRDFLQNTVAQSYTVHWKRQAFFYFVENFNNTSLSVELKAKIITSILLPCFVASFDKGEGNKLIGALPTPFQEDNSNIASVFISKVFDPDKPYANDDALRIALLQFACLLVEHASQHIHDGGAKNKSQGSKLRRLMTFAWPCLLSKNSIDPTARYHGHLLLAHIIARLAIHKKIVLQVFHSLLKGHSLEARPVVRQALDVLTPAMPLRMEDGNAMLTHWTIKIIVEEGYSMQQLFHILQLIVRHYKIYFPVRHQLVVYLVNYMQRLGFPANATLEHKTISVDMAEVIIKWELQRIKDYESKNKLLNSSVDISGEDFNESQRKNLSTDTTRSSTSTAASLSIQMDESCRPIGKLHSDTVLNFLIRLACQVNDSPPTTLNLGDNLSRRCIILLKMAMRPDVFPQPFGFKLNWMDKIFTTIESPDANLNNICTALDFLTFLTNIMKADQLLAIIRPIQKGLSACIIHPNTKNVPLLHTLITRLMMIFPPDTQHKNDELELLYSVISKMIVDNLTLYENSTEPNPSSLLGALMILKDCCANNPGYIDRLMLQFIRVLHRLTREHIAMQNNSAPVTTTLAERNRLSLELLILSLDMIKNRIGLLSVGLRRLLISGIITSLIEKSNDSKILKFIVKMLDDWVRVKEQHLLVQIPSIREKSVLLVKLMQYVEKKFHNEPELHIQLLEMINYIYRDEHLKKNEFCVVLQGAFMQGLRSQNPAIRAKFFEIIDASMHRRPHGRLLYIICSQAWDAIGTHYWIKQCIELLILTANTTRPIQNANDMHKIPSVTSIINMADNEEKSQYVRYTSSDTDCMDMPQVIDDDDEEFEVDVNLDYVKKRSQQDQTDNEKFSPTRNIKICKLIHRQIEFLEINRKIRTDQLLMATSQLCHMDTSLAESVWLSIFPRIWSIFDSHQQHSIVHDVIPFLSSGSNIIQKDSSPSAINTFVESLTHCDPKIYIPPNLCVYLGKAHNLWHRMTLVLEEMVSKQNVTNSGFLMDDSLAQMYSAMHEEDLWAGVWMNYAQYSETNLAISYEQMGFFEEAQGAYDLAMSRYKDDLSNGIFNENMNSEIMLWENHYIRCTKELDQWDTILEYAQNKREQNEILIMESAWRVPDWNLMKKALLKVEQAHPEQYGYKVNLYKGYLSILNPEEQQLANGEKYVEIASRLCIREWCRLPHIVSHIHQQYLQAAQHIIELYEANQIYQIKLQSRNTSLPDMKGIVKTWRNRLPIITDDLSHWSEIFTWRQHLYQIVTQHLEEHPDQGNTMLGIHASAKAIIYFAKIARKHNLAEVCQLNLARIYTIPSVPVVDCFQKIRQEVKCFIQTASSASRKHFEDALNVIESTNIKFFTAEMIAEFYALKGFLLSKVGDSEEASKVFSAAVQLHRGLTKAWAMWGDFMEHMFLCHTQIALGVNALTCYLHACRQENESKTRKYLAKVLWLLSYDNVDNALMSTLEKYSRGMPPSHWLPWIPQLLCCLVQYDGIVILNILSSVGRLYPQAVYFPIRTLYLTLKIEQREKHKTAEQASGRPHNLQQNLESNQVFTSGSTSVNPIRATPPMWRCSKVMHAQREVHPTTLSSLEGIVDQMVWFRESWTEEVLRQLRQGLIKCYAIAFETRSTVSKATITPHTLHFVKKLDSTFGIGIENIPGSVASSSSYSSASESLARRAQVTFQDPEFQTMKELFTRDFDFTKPDSMKLHNLITKLKSWIKALEIKVKKLPTSFLLEDKCRFLSNFSQKTAEVELPGEFLIPSSSHYHIRISRFMPIVEIVQKNNTAARRLHIRGTNGKIYPYLVAIDTGLGDARGEERVLQLLRMLNSYLEKQKETTRRFLNITVPRVVPISPQMRLVEDNPASIPLYEIYKRACAKIDVEHDLPIMKYYERLSEVQSRGAQITHKILRDIFQEIQRNIVPKTLLKRWAIKTFVSATDFWQFRKMMTLQMALAFLCEYALHLTRLNTDMIYIHQDSGLMNVSYFKFEINDDEEELDHNRPVPFRLTPNVAEFLTSIGISGPLSAAIVATARCFGHPNYKLSSILKTILRDEIISLHKKRVLEPTDVMRSGSVDANITENMKVLVNKTVNAILNRLTTISYFDKIESQKMSILLQRATNQDNLCRMDPAWHPWL